MRAYIAFYDDRVAAVFKDYKHCNSFCQGRLRNNGIDVRYYFGLKVEWNDERGNHHTIYSSDYSID